MSRNKLKIIQAVEEKGYTVGYIDYRPLGGNVEMIGREGGWTVRVDDGEDLVDYVLGYTVQDVLEGIKGLPKAYVAAE